VVVGHEGVGRLSIHEPFVLKAIKLNHASDHDESIVCMYVLYGVDSLPMEVTASPAAVAIG